MSKAKWGIAAILIVAAVILWALGENYWPGALRDPETRSVAGGKAGGDGEEPAVQTDGTGKPGAEQAADSDNGSGDAPADPGTRSVAEAEPGADGGETDRGGEPGAEGAADSETRSSTSSADTESGGGALQQEAESYIEQLAAPSDEPVSMESAETFIGPDRPLTTEAIEDQPDTDVAEVKPETRAVRSTSEAPPAVPASAGEDTMESDTGPAQQAAGSEVEPGGAAGSNLKTTIDLPVTEESPVTIAEILGPEEDIPADAVFYVHTVKPENDQGIWGIVHTGILENFAEGVAVHRGQQTKTYQVAIPRHADERRPDSSSSFLGKLIHQKSTQSYVYNYQTGRIGRNPDIILPGQEIVIVSFTPAELIAIYRHFVRRES